MMSSDDENTLTYKELAALITALGVEGSISGARKKLKETPEDINAHYRLAIALKIQGDKENAIRHLEECVRIAGNNWWPYAKLEAGVRELFAELKDDVR